MKRIFALLLLASTLSLSAQTNTPTVSGGLDTIWQAVANSETNWLFEAHALYAPKLQKKYGGGIGIDYPISKYVFAGIRVDYVDGGFWMPQGQFGLQAPLTIPFINAKATPFVYTGVGVPLSGAIIGNFTIPGKRPTDNNGQATAIVGTGTAVRLWTSADGNKLFDIAGDIEQWSGFDGNQYRGAVVFKWNF